MTFTHPFTVAFRREPFTLPATLHGYPTRERESTFTDTFTTFTRPDLHARHPLYRGGRVCRGWES